MFLLNLLRATSFASVSLLLAAGTPLAQADFSAYQGYNPRSGLLFPRGSNAKSLFVLVHGSGEYGVEPKVKRKASGGLTKITGFNAMLPGQLGAQAAFPVAGQGTITPVGNGRVIKIGIPGVKGQLRIVQNTSGTSARVFLVKKGSKAASTIANADTSNFFWNGTYTQLGQAPGQFNSFGRYTPVYNLPPPRSFGAEPQVSGTSFVDLPADVLTALSDVGRVGTKAVVMATLAAAREIDAATLTVLNPNNQSLLNALRQLCSVGTGISKNLAFEDPLNFTDPLVSIKSEEVAWLGDALQGIADAALTNGTINPNLIIAPLGNLAAIPVRPLSDELRLVVAYTWGTDQQDLDTGTEFLGNTVGFAYADTAAYLLWTGDDVNGGGAEVVVVDINAAIVAQDAVAPFMVNCFAGWYTPAGGFGPATLTFAIVNSTNGEHFGAISKTINPGTQSGQATTPVGSAVFDYDPVNNLITYDFQ